MAKPKIEEITADLTNILKIASHFSYLWEKGAPLYGEEIIFTSTFTAPDESWHMGVQKKNGQFFFNTRYSNGKLSPLEASKALLGVGYIGKLGALSNDFKESLMEPLGKYLAQKEMGRLRKKF